jgi:tRNA (cmo5U34)-methyltransferase
VGQFHWKPEEYLALMHREVPDYQRVQDEVAGASTGLRVERALELGVGTGETARRVLRVHPGASLVGVDASEEMLARAREALPGADLRLARLEDPLPDGPFELVFSALALHHLDGPGKEDLIKRIALVLSPGGRVVIGDVVVPADPHDAVTPLDAGYDMPSTVVEQLGWLAEAGFASATVTWSNRDLAVLVGQL